MILVTGGAGFIGSAIIHQLNKSGRENIIVCDHFGTENKWRNLRGLKYETFIPVENLLTYLSKNPDVKTIFHMGACSDTTEEDMDFLYQNNTDFTNRLFSWATTQNVPIVYASSAATYGNGEQGYRDDHQGIPKLRPLNKYGYSKQLSDEWILSQDQKPDVWFGVKFFNVFGPNEYHKGKMSSVVYHAFEQIQDVGEVKLFKSHKEGFEDGEQLRDFVYVKDVVKAMIDLVHAGTKNKELSGIYNLGTGKARTFFDLVSATFDALNLKTKIKFIDMPESLRGQYQYYTEAHMEKFKKALPDFHFLSLEDAIKDYVTHHLNKNDSHLNIHNNEG